MLTDGVSHFVHPDDEMMNFILKRNRPRELYFTSGAQHTKIFVDAIKKINPSFTKKNILEYGCGHGRITRHLNSIFHYSKLTVADVWDEAVNFCGKEFNANTFVVSQENKISSLTEKFDIIISYSVFSHLPPHLFEFTLSELSKILDSNGLFLFTAKGEFHVKKFNLSMENGYHFGRESNKKNETKGRIPDEQYSLMVVTESFVKNLLKKAGLELLYHISSSNLPSKQDLYVVKRA